MGKFEEAYAVNVNDKTEKKGNLTYLSWAFAWAEFKKLYPNATYKVDQFGGAFCSGNEKTGFMVRTEVTAGEQTYEMWLPVMDGRNNAILSPKMTEINKASMRCLTKNLAMFGLGLYIYAGEDLPESPKDFAPITVKELLDVWRVQDVEKTVRWYEKQLGVAFPDWGADECEAVRESLSSRKTANKKKPANEAKTGI
ncbi:MAG: DUF1071 domain-containing protein [Clostridia bacterium]|nr:DUF1071 domain-containing protein [Clostridia bacterium]